MQNNTRYKIQDTRYKNGFTLLNNFTKSKIAAKRHLTGFTLVEVLVSITVFVLVMGVATGLFVHVLQNQRKVLAYQELLDQTSFVMEYMTRGIRMAKKQRTATDPIACFDAGFVGHNYQIVSPSHLKFIRWDHLQGVAGEFICYKFYLDNVNHRLMRKRGVATSTPLTSPELRVTALRFKVIGDGIEPGEQIQPRVTIVLEVEGREYDPGKRPKLHLQTTVSQRDLDN